MYFSSSNLTVSQLNQIYTNGQAVFSGSLSSTQTITGNKTFDYSQCKLSLTNTTNDTTSTNQILLMNSSGNVVPCDKTYSSLSGGTPGYASLLNSNGSKYTSIAVTNPYSSTSVLAIANISKTTDGDGNQAQFSNVVPVITSSTITFNIRSDTDWVINTYNAYTLFYNIIPYPSSNQTYSYSTTYIPNLVNYWTFDSSNGTDSVGSSSFNTSGGSFVTPSKFGSFAFQPGNGNGVQVSSFNNLSFSMWWKTGTSFSNPFLHMNFDNTNWSDIGTSNQSLSSGVGTLKFTWAGATSSTISYNGTIFNHVAISITAGGTTQLYWNGSLIISTNTSGLADSGLITQFQIYDYNSGDIWDDFRLYNRALTAAEINAIYNTTPSNITYLYYNNPVIPNLVYYWNFDSSVTDSVASKNFTGTINYSTKIYKWGTAAISNSGTINTTLSTFASYNGFTFSFWAATFSSGLLHINPTGGLNWTDITTTNITSTTCQIGVSGGNLPSTQYSAVVPYNSSNFNLITFCVDLTKGIFTLYYNATVVVVYQAPSSDTYYKAATWTTPNIYANYSGTCYLDDLRVYSRQLQPSEISAIYSTNPIYITTTS
jgi:hypothetical protein